MLETVDAMLLNYTVKVIEMNTSGIFLGHPRKFQSVSNEAQRSVRKCIEGKV